MGGGENMAFPREAAERLVNDGWASFASAANSNESIISIAGSLGTTIRSRTGKLIETLAPQNNTTAPVASLSYQFGFGALPLHSDTAHWIVPCRYIVLACTEVGSVRAPTLIVDAQDPNFSDEELLLLRSATFLVRNGGKSFYASLVDRNRGFVRADPGCMEPMTSASVTAMGLFDIKRQADRVISFDWNAGDVLVIDNWRMLHGRGNDMPADPQRRLVRAYVR
jgi:hypothetical protein